MKEKHIETWVGAFVLIGLVVAGALVVQFGRFGHYFQQSYDIVVEFEDASGIIKDSQVLYRGARVGTVTERPMIEENGQFVTLPLRINSGIQIPETARFQIGSYGLLGDRFVNIIPPDETTDQYLQPEARVRGERATGLTELVQEMRPVLQRLNAIAVRLDEEILTEEFAENFQEVVAKAGSAADRLDGLLAEAQDGKGLLHMLLKDEHVAQELRETVNEIRMLSHNLRTRGILFYSDVAGREQKAAARGEDSSQGTRGGPLMRSRDR